MYQNYQTTGLGTLYKGGGEGVKIQANKNFFQFWWIHVSTTEDTGNQWKTEHHADIVKRYRGVFRGGGAKLQKY